MQNSNKKVWFKQFWPWFLIVLPMTAVIGGVSTVIIATHHKPEMVVDDYYKKGKAINSDLTLLKNAQQLKISALIRQSNNELIISLKGLNDNSPIKLFLFHSTLADRDIAQLLTADGRGNFHFSSNTDLTGKWQLRIEPFDKKWRLQKTVTFPTKRISL